MVRKASRGVPAPPRTPSGRALLITCPAKLASAREQDFEVEQHIERILTDAKHNFEETLNRSRGPNSATTRWILDFSSSK